MSADAIELGRAEHPPVFDVIYCSGVLYHLPNPLDLLISLHRMTGQHVILGSTVTGTRVENEAGSIAIPAGATLFIPALSQIEREVLRVHWTPYIGEDIDWLQGEISWDPKDFRPWWWLPTIDCLKAMCRSVGFQIEDESPIWNGLAHILLLSKRMTSG
jgi:hypothetical protein